MADPRFLIGQGEKLSEEIARPPRGMGDKAHPYEFYEARHSGYPLLATSRRFPHLRAQGAKRC